MSTNKSWILKIGLFLSVAALFSVSGVAQVSKLSVAGDPVSKTGEIYVSGDSNTSMTNTLVFNITDGSITWTRRLGENSGADMDSEAGPFNFTFDLSNFDKRFSAGQVAVKAEQTDAQVVQSVDDNANFTIDSSGPPEPELISVKALPGGKMNVTFGDVNSSEAETVEYRINRSKQGSSSILVATVEDTDSNQSFIDSGLSNGTEYFYQVRAVDSVGNLGLFSGVKSDLADSYGPGFSRLSPVPGFYTSDQSKKVSFNVSDYSGVDMSELKINISDTDPETELLNAGPASEHVSVEGKRVTVDPSGSTSFDYNPGTVDIGVKAFDNVGNSGKKSWSFTVDIQAPQNIQVDNPVDGAVVQSQDTISGSFTEDNKIDFVEIQIQRLSDSKYWTGSQFTSSSQWVNVSDPAGWSFNSSDITSVDTYVVDVRATDEAGNTGYLPEKINYSIDKGDPALQKVKTSDTDYDGRLDRLKVVFTEPIQDLESDLNSAFEVSQGVLGLYSTGSRTDDEIIFLPISNLDTGQAPRLKMVTGLEDVSVVDEAGNSLTSNDTYNVLDRAKPVLLYSEVNPVMSNSSKTVVRTKWSEPVKDSTRPTDDLQLEKKTLGFLENATQEVRNVDFGEPLRTGRTPNISGIVSVSDSVGNPGVLEKEENVSVSTFRRELVKGWNFVSFPISSNSAPAIERFAPASKVEEVWTYTNGNWKLYNPDKPVGSNLTAVRAGEGYLFNVENSYTLSPNVENIPDPGIGVSTLPSIKIREGWNLVGHFQEFNQQPGTGENGAFSSLGGAFGVVKSQRTSGGLMVDRAFSVVRPGHAYWISPDGDLSDGYVKYTER
ncbi:MAG: hypothetical protein ABEK10_01270 [Candidatus Nanosalina sp.]